MVRSRGLGIALILIISGLVFSAYSNSLQGGFVYDDVFFIQENPLIRDLNNLPTMFTSAFWEASSRPSKSFYRPIVVLSYAVNYALGGFNPFGYHLLNLLLHIANVLLVFALVYLVSHRTLFSAAVALLFGLHPLTTEAVAWVSGRTDLLGAFFSIGSLTLYILAYPPDVSSSHRVSPVRLFWILSILSFLLGLFSKESAATTVALVALYEVASRRPLKPQHGTRLLSYLAALAVYLGWRLAVLGGSLGKSGLSVVSNPLIVESTLPRLFTGIKIFGKYLWLLFFPLKLAPDYSFNAIPVAHTIWEPGVVVSGLAGLVLLGLWFIYWRRKPLLFFGLGFFFATGSLIFANALFPYGAIFAERFMYLPSVGFVLVSVGLASQAVEAMPARTRVVTAGLLATLVVSCFASRTWIRNLDWRDDFSLFRSAVEVNPQSAINRYGIAYQYFRKGEFAKARVHYIKSLEIYSDYDMAHFGLGNLALGEKNYPEAVEHLRKAIKHQPNFDEFHVSLGAAYRGLGRLDEAQKEYETALRLNHKNAKTYNNLANIFLLRGEPQKSLELWNKAVAINPFNAEALYNLALHYEKTGRKDEARTYYTQFLAVAPDRLQLLKAQVRAKLGAH